MYSGFLGEGFVCALPLPRFGIISAVSNKVKFDDPFIFLPTSKGKNDETCPRAALSNLLSCMCFPLVTGWGIMDYTDLPHSSTLSGRRISFWFLYERQTYTHLSNLETVVLLHWVLREQIKNSDLYQSCHIDGRWTS